jgi:hypothetical protein
MQQKGSENYLLLSRAKRERLSVIIDLKRPQDSKVHGRGPLIR